MKLIHVKVNLKLTLHGMCLNMLNLMMSLFLLHQLFHLLIWLSLLLKTKAISKYLMMSSDVFYTSMHCLLDLLLLMELQEEFLLMIVEILITIFKFVIMELMLLLMNMVHLDLHQLNIRRLIDLLLMSLLLKTLCLTVIWKYK